MPLPPRQPFQLPSTVTIVFREEKDGRVSAHALDFDLVSTDADREQAMKKIRLAITSLCGNRPGERMGRHPLPCSRKVLAGTRRAAGSGRSNCHSESRLGVARRHRFQRLHIVNERRGITADTALRFARYFKNSPAFWMNLHTRYDLEVAEDEIAAKVARGFAYAMRLP